MDEYDSGVPGDIGSQRIFNGGEFHWLQVIKFIGAPDIKIDGVTYDVYGYQKWRRDKSRPFTRLELVPNGGQIVVIAGQWYEDADINQGAALLGATNTSASEIDSGPVAVAAGVAPTPIIALNNGRVRGVTVQNVGVTVVALSKTPALSQSALANAAYLLSADSAANAGNGGSVVFDGWQGGIWAVNVAGGPGSLLVSAF